MTPEQIKDELTAASAGLLYPSESDEPFEAFAWPAGYGQTPKQALEQNAPGKSPVVEQSVNAFFGALHTVGVHDCFDLYCQAHHAGDQKAAIRAAAEELGMARTSSGTSTRKRRSSP